MQMMQLSWSQSALALCAAAVLTLALTAPATAASCSDPWSNGSAFNSCWDASVTGPSEGKCTIEATCSAVRTLSNTQALPSGCTLIDTQGSVSNYGCDSSLEYDLNTTSTLSNCDGTLTLGSCGG